MVACKARRVSHGGGDGGGRRETMSLKRQTSNYIFIRISRGQTTLRWVVKRKPSVRGKARRGWGGGWGVETVIKKLGAIVVARGKERKKQTLSITISFKDAYTYIVRSPPPVIARTTPLAADNRVGSGVLKTSFGEISGLRVFFPSGTVAGGRRVVFRK